MQGKVIIEVTPPEAKVFLNEKLVGTAEMLSGKILLVPTGKYRLRVMADGYFSKYIEVSIKSEIRRIKVKLRKHPPPLYKKSSSYN